LDLVTSTGGRSSRVRGARLLRRGGSGIFRHLLEFIQSVLGYQESALGGISFLQLCPTGAPHPMVGLDCIW